MRKKNIYKKTAFNSTSFKQYGKERIFTEEYQEQKNKIGKAKWK